MTKRTYIPYRIEDLTGGLNTRDYPSEIEEKQSVDLLNWNFEGNKLVSSNGINELYNEDTFIQGMTVDGNDVRYIENGNLNKNGDIEYYYNSYKLNIEDIDGKLFDIEIDGNRYVFDLYFNNETTAYNIFVSDLNSLLGSSYNIEKDSSQTFINIHKDNGAEINFVNPDIIKSFTLSDWNVGNAIDITIDGVNIQANQEDYPLSSDLETYIISQLPINTYVIIRDGIEFKIYREDLANIIISANTVNHYSYEIRVNDYDNPSGYNLGGTPPETRDVNCYYVQIDVDGTTYRYDYPNGIQWTAYNFNYTIPYYGSVTHYSSDKCGAIVWGDFYDYVDAGGTPYQITSTAELDDYGTQSINEYKFSFRRNDWAEVLYINEVGYVIDSNLNTLVATSPEGANAPLNNGFDETVITTTVTIDNYSDLTWTEENIGLNITNDMLLDDFYDITVSSYGILLVSKRGFNPIFIDIDGTVNSIGISQVGTPTVGTIYNGKIILGGYEGKDNIVFSGTDDPVASGNEMLDFAATDAGAQSVSGGNKGKITGMKVGENGLYIFKGNEVWYSNTEKIEAGVSFNFIFNKITSNGAVNQASISEVEQEIFYFDYRNRAVRRLGYEQNLTTLRDVALSREVENIFKAIPEDNEGADERFSTLISTSYSYPNFEVHITTDTSPYFFLTGADENFKYRLPNKTLVYNVERKSWTVRSDKDSLGILHAFKGYFATNNGEIYQDNVGNTTEVGNSLSKEYVHGDDIRYKKYGRFDIVGQIIPDSGQTKTLTIDVVIDDEIIETREIEADTITQVKERIDLYDIGQKFQFKLGHTGQGKVEVYDVTLYDKVTNIQPQDFS